MRIIVRHSYALLILATLIVGSGGLWTTPAFAETTCAPGKFCNPLGGVDTLDGFLIRILTWLLGTVALFAMIALVWGGLQMILAFGDEARVRNAKRTIWWAIVGFAVAGLATAILVTVNILLRG